MAYAGASAMVGPSDRVVHGFELAKSGTGYHQELTLEPRKVAGCYSDKPSGAAQNSNNPETIEGEPAVQSCWLNFAKTLRSVGRVASLSSLVATNSSVAVPVGAAKFAQLRQLARRPELELLDLVPRHSEVHDDLIEKHRPEGRHLQCTRRRHGGDELLHVVGVPVFDAGALGEQ